LQGLGSIYLFRNHTEVESFDRYSNTGYKSLRPGHQYEIGARECDGFISNTFSSASSSAPGYSSRYQADFYASFTSFLEIKLSVAGAFNW
uniref:Outer membrane beta-barrel protein n=1 Tax=Gongylonema pulchrum TaxID=637853 RepID=A0A183D456_9BILA